MSVETLVAIAERGDHWRDLRQLVEHPIDVNVTRVHDEIDPAKTSNTAGGRCSQASGMWVSEMSPIRIGMIAGLSRARA